jgi:hypothetical protein
VDFVALRRALAANTKWDDELTDSIMPGAAQRRTRNRAMTPGAQ